MRTIPEKDWKRLRAMKEAKIDQVCESILNSMKAAMKEHGHHKSYLEVWDIIRAGDENIAEMFDDLKRSNAVFKLAAWQRHDLLNEDELKEFSEETQGSIDVINR